MSPKLVPAPKAGDPEQEKMKRQIAFYREILAQKLKDPSMAQKAALIISEWIAEDKSLKK